MDIRLNNFKLGSASIGQIQGDKPADAAPATKNATNGDVSVTELPANPEDLAVSDIPESALSRDDPLGKLVSAAFNLPAPPAPFPMT